MNESQVNNFLRCLLHIDDLNYLALHAHATVRSALNSSETQHSQSSQSINPDPTDHDYDESSSYDVLVAKVTAMVVLFCASTLCGSIPFALNKFFHWTEEHTNARSATVVKCLLYFGGGVLLATTFLHLLPEVQEAVEQLQECDIIPDLEFSLAELLMCIGFFLMYLIEEVLHTYIHQHMRLMGSDAGAGAAFERGRSIRNSYLVTGKTAANESTEEGVHNEDTQIGLTSTSNSPSVSEINVGNIVSVPTLSIQNLIANDVENQKYNKQAHNKEPQKYEPQQTHYHHHHHHHDHQHQPSQDQALGHSHVPIGNASDSKDAITSSLRGLFIVLALSLHELFEGMAIGLESNASDVWFMFGAVSAHKLVLAFCVGVELIVARTRFVLCAVYVLTFAIVSPIGIGIGILISHSDGITSPNIPSAILQGLACGTLLYVVFFEILSKNHSGLVAYFSLLVGFLIMFGLQQLGSEGHSHSHGSCASGNDHDHDHDDLMLLNRVEHAYTTQVPASAIRSHSHEEDKGDFMRELKILRQASDNLFPKTNKVH
ncbi:protein zntC [Bactrocera tryoni]|uniref:protein zntC n=1 Tax=Bactrocera tryoni TaxID=59916 RepID=UPI001A969A32|nr:protein zntC [Bactrocera tryoni]XP_039968614.1 protein zntC [Bactrocera tryoni]